MPHLLALLHADLALSVGCVVVFGDDEAQISCRSAQWRRRGHRTINEEWVDCDWDCCGKRGITCIEDDSSCSQEAEKRNEFSRARATTVPVNTCSKSVNAVCGASTRVLASSPATLVQLWHSTKWLLIIRDDETRELSAFCFDTTNYAYKGQL